MGKFDVVYTLEVMEHIPAQFHDKITTFLVERTKKYMLFSAAQWVFPFRVHLGIKISTFCVERTQQCLPRDAVRFCLFIFEWIASVACGCAARVSMALQQNHKTFGIGDKEKYPSFKPRVLDKTGCFLATSELLGGIFGSGYSHK